jgi:hypothetical protein
LLNKGEWRMEPLSKGFVFVCAVKHQHALHSSESKAKIFVLNRLKPLKTADGFPCVRGPDLHACKLTPDAKGNMTIHLIVATAAYAKFEQAASATNFVWQPAAASLPEAKRPARQDNWQPIILGHFGPVPPSSDAAFATDADLQNYVNAQLPETKLSVRFLQDREWGVRSRHAEFKTTSRAGVDRLLSMPMPFPGRPFVDQVSHPFRCCTKCWRSNSHGLSRCPSPQKLCPRCRGRHPLSECTVPPHRCLVCRVAGVSHDSNHCPRLAAVKTPWQPAASAAPAGAPIFLAPPASSAASLPAPGSYAAAAASHAHPSLGNELASLRVKCDEQSGLITALTSAISGLALIILRLPESLVNDDDIRPILQLWPALGLGSPQDLWSSFETPVSPPVADSSQQQQQPPSPAIVPPQQQSAAAPSTQQETPAAIVPPAQLSPRAAPAASEIKQMSLDDDSPPGDRSNPVVELKRPLTDSAKRRAHLQRRAEKLARQSAAPVSAAPASKSRGEKALAAAQAKASAADAEESKGSSSSHKRNSESVADASRTSPLRKKLGKPGAEDRDRPVAGRSISVDAQDSN